MAKVAKKATKKGKYNSDFMDTDTPSPDLPAPEASRVRWPCNYRDRSGSGGA